MAFRRWFPTSITKQADFFENFTRVFIGIADSLGFSAEDIAKLEDDNKVMHYLATMEISLDGYTRSFKSLKRNLTNGKGETKAEYRQFTTPPDPPVVPYGIFERLFKLADRITAAEKYTTVIGAQLQILQKSHEAVRTEELQPHLKARVLSQARVEVRFKRGDTDGVNLFFRRTTSEQNLDLGRFFHSPAIVKIPLLEADKPEQIYLFGLYLERNEIVGQPSNSVILVISP